MEKRYYVDGNTVRKTEEPAVWEQSQPQLTEEERKKEARRLAAKENRKRSKAVKVKFVAFVSVSVAAITATAVVMIQAQSAVTASMKRVAALESQVSDLRAENDAKYNEIVTSVDLNYIKKVATEELGMSYADEDQIEYYTIEKNNFMDQYSDIPK